MGLADESTVYRHPLKLKNIRRTQLACGYPFRHQLVPFGLVGDRYAIEAFIAEKDRRPVDARHQVAVGVILGVQAGFAAASADTYPEHFRKFLPTVRLGCQFAGVLT
jgi:hypothetical protein